MVVLIFIKTAFVYNNDIMQIINTYVRHPNVKVKLKLEYEF